MTEKIRFQRATVSVEKYHDGNGDLYIECKHNYTSLKIHDYGDGWFSASLWHKNNDDIPLRFAHWSKAGLGMCSDFSRRENDFWLGFSYKKLGINIPVIAKVEMYMPE